jgi:uncharacterized protein (TIGR04141 family)
VSTPTTAIDEKKLASTQSYGPIPLEAGEATLFVGASGVHPPEWAGWLIEGFGDDVEIPPVGGASAVVIVRVERAGKDCFLAFTFGQGRSLLRPDAFERGFGLRTALNIVFEGDDGSEDIDPARLRSIDAKRVGQHILRSRHQVSDVASLEGLDVDSRRDLLRGVTGVPQDEKVWGGRVTGADPLIFSFTTTMSSIDEVCRLILDANESVDYQVRFKFIDEARMVTDPVLRAVLEEEVLGALRGGELSDLGLAPPDLIDWERVSRFQYHSETRTKQFRHELRLEDYIGSLKADQVAVLDRDKLRSYRIRAVDSDGHVVPPDWSVWACLYGEVNYNSKTYLLEGGDFYEVSKDFLDALEGALSAIAVCDKSLPAWTLGSTEEDYNRAAADSSSAYLLLDRKTVKVTRQTTAIEMCDVLTSDACWIHVKKRSDGSRGLGHLFWQGFVSAELLLSDPVYRRKAIEKIRAAAEERATRDGDPTFPARFAIVKEESVSAADQEVVFAIIGKWNGKGLETLPFFSKIALREMASELDLRGVKVSIKLIPPE